jgi:hypothetical protein
MSKCRSEVSEPLMNQRIMARALGGAFVRHEHRSYVALQAGSRVYG